MIKILHKQNRMRNVRRGRPITPKCVMCACLCVSVSPEGIRSNCNITVSVRAEAE